MPWNAKQLKFFRAAAHNPAIAKSSGIKQSDAERMSKEGLKKMAGGGKAMINRQDTKHGKMDMPFTNLSRYAGMKKGGMMKKRRFDEGGEIDYEVDENAEPERRSFGSGVSAKDREYNEPVSKPAAKAKPKAKPEAKPAAKESGASESAYTKAAKASFLGSPSKYLSEPLKRMRERMSSGDQQAFKPRDRGFNKGGMMKNFKNLFKGKETYGEEMKEAKAIKSGKITPKQYAMGEESEKSKKFAKGGSIRRMADGGMTAPMAPPMAPQAPVDPRKLAAMQAAMQAQGGAAPMAPGMKRGGSVKYAKGGGIESRGKTKGTIIRMASGGSVSSASRRADGIAQRGKTRC